MRSRFFWIFLVLAGCSDDPELDDTTKGADSTPEETAPEDSAAPEDSSIPEDTFVGETSTADTFVEETDSFVVVDTFVPETLADTFVADTFVADTFVADTFKPDTFVPDTCVVNACGGCTTLTATPGTPCGACGLQTCTTDKTSVICLDPGKNACGACGTLTGTPGAACGACGTQTCAADGRSTTCSDPGLNACGGCGSLGATPGASCGSCGKQTCAADKKSVTCVDPGLNACGGCGSLGATPGASCGSCGTQTCSADKASVSCVDPGLNACGGCGSLSSAPGSLCGTCGTYTCSSTTTVTCTETTPSVSNDYMYRPTVVEGMSPAMSTDKYAFAYATKNRGRIVGITLRILGAGALSSGGVRINMYTGTPAAPTSGVLATAFVDESVIPHWYVGTPMTPPPPIGFDFMSPGPSLPAGTPVFFEALRTAGSTVYAFYGTSSGGPSDLSTYYYSGSWTSKDPFDVAITIAMDMCP